MRQGVLEKLPGGPITQGRDDGRVAVVSFRTPSSLSPILRAAGFVVDELVVAPGPSAVPAPALAWLLDTQGDETAALGWLADVAATPGGQTVPVVACVSMASDVALTGTRRWLEAGCLACLPVAEADPTFPALAVEVLRRLSRAGGRGARLQELSAALATMVDGRFRVTRPEEAATLGVWLDETFPGGRPDPAGVVELLTGTIELRARTDGPRGVDLCFHRGAGQLSMSIASGPALGAGARGGLSLDEARLWQGEVLAPWEREQLAQALELVLERATFEDASCWRDVARFVAGELASEMVVVGYLDRRGRWASLVAVGAGDLAAAGDLEGPRGAALGDAFRTVLAEGRPVLCNRPVGKPSLGRPWRRTAAVPLLREGRVVGSLHVANRTVDYGDRDLGKLFLIGRRLTPLLALSRRLELVSERLAHTEALLVASGSPALEVDLGGRVHYETPFMPGLARSPDVAPLPAPDERRERTLDDWPALGPLSAPLLEAGTKVVSSGHAADFDASSPQGVVSARLAPLANGHVGLFLRPAGNDRTREAQAQRFFELSLDMLAVLEDDRVVRVNEAFVDVVGWKDADLLGQSPAEVVHPDDRTTFLGMLRGLSGAVPRAAELQVRVLAKGGLVRVVDWRAIRQQATVFLVGRDVTEERRALESLASQHAELSRRHRDTVEDHAIARRVLAGVIREGCLDAPFISYSLSPLAVFNGDVALAAETPDGSLRWLLGDFAGHGLSGAIGTIPLASTFHATSRKGVSLSETLVTLNDSLRSILPPWLFCAAALIELDPSGTRLAIWNAGLPAVIVRHVDGSLLRLGSRHAPLGILEPQEFATTFEQVAVAEGDRVVTFSDGLVEAKRADGKEWGLPAIEALIAHAPPGTRLMEILLDGVETFRSGAPRSDDTSLVEVVVAPGPRLRSPI